MIKREALTKSVMKFYHSEMQMLNILPECKDTVT